MNDNFIKTDGSDNVLELNLTMLVIQDGNYYVAYCPALNLSSYGDSIEDAKEAFKEVMQDYIEDTQERNTLQKDLLAHGWVLRNAHTATPPEMSDIPDVPTGLLKAMYQDTWLVPAS